MLSQLIPELISGGSLRPFCSYNSCKIRQHVFTTVLLIMLLKVYNNDFFIMMAYLLFVSVASDDKKLRRCKQTDKLNTNK